MKCQWGWPRSAARVTRRRSEPWGGSVRDAGTVVLDAADAEVASLLGELHVGAPAVEHEHGADLLVHVGAAALACGGDVHPRSRMQERDLPAQLIQLAPGTARAEAIRPLQQRGASL